MLNIVSSLKLFLNLVCPEKIKTLLNILARESFTERTIITFQPFAIDGLF
jgi:hypothetical protein